MNDSTASTEDPRFAGVRDWFATLQERIIAAGEALECEFDGVGGDRPPGLFAIEPWERTDASGAPGGGGRMAMLRGRLFEKMGVHFSVVHGAFPMEFASQIPGADRDPRFWAAGVSVIAPP
jgi:coproporphyrinogen III oxidase